MADWKEQEEARKLGNNQKCKRFRQEAVRVWSEEKARAKHEKQKFTEKKPKQEKLDSPIPKPPLPGGDDSSSTGSDTEKDDGNEAEDGD